MVGCGRKSVNRELLLGIEVAVSAGKKFSNKVSKEVFLRLRILFFCNLKYAIARENALLQLKPFKVAQECCKFEQYLISNHITFKTLTTSFQVRFLVYTSGCTNEF